MDEWMGPVRVLRFPLTARSRNYPLSLSLFRYLRQNPSDFDIIHAHNYHTLVGHAAIVGSLPFIFTPHYHGTGHTGFRAVLHQIVPARGCQAVRCGRCGCMCFRRRTRPRACGLPDVASKVVTIPNGTDPKKRVSGQDQITLVRADGANRGASGAVQECQPDHRCLSGPARLRRRSW